MFTFLAPRLYVTVVLQTPNHCLDTLRFLISQPHVAGVVKELILEPLHFVPLKLAHMTEPNERRRPLLDLMPLMDDMIDLVCQLARHLCSLEKFVWGGWDAPKHDEVWDLLRLQYVCCYMK
jgi:hypothetical protein